MQLKKIACTVNKQKKKRFMQAKNPPPPRPNHFSNGPSFFPLLQPALLPEPASRVKDAQKAAQYAFPLWILLWQVASTFPYCFIHIYPHMECLIHIWIFSLAQSRDTPLLPRPHQKKLPHLPSPKKCIGNVLDFSWDTFMSQEKLQTMIMQNFFLGGGGGKRGVLWDLCK